MHAHNLLIDDGTHGHAIENVTELLPQLDVVASLAFIIEAIDTCDGCALMVSTQQEEILGELHLVGEKQDDGLQALLSTVDVVTQKEVVAFRWKATILKETKEVMILAMDVATDLQGSFQLQQGTLIQEDGANGRAQALHLILRDLDQLSGLTSLDFKALVHHLVNFKLFRLLHGQNNQI